MFRYRFVQTTTLGHNLIQSNFSLSPYGYHHFRKDLVLKGWIISKRAQPDRLTIHIYSSHKRKLLRVKEFELSPDVNASFPEIAGSDRSRFSVVLSAATISEIANRQDFALEFVARVKNRNIPFKTISFVRDGDKTNMLFVVGSPRSGTSILGNSLSEALMKRNRYGEVHILALMHELEQKVNEYYGATPASYLKSNMLSEFNRYLLIARIQQLFKTQYAGVAENNYFVDKTPGIPMLLALPTIMQMWPQAKVIFAKRRGIENIVSRMRKFPEVSFEDHCHQWVRSMNIWQSLKKSIPNAIEIDQFDIQNVPEEVAVKLKEFLKLDTEQEQKLLHSFMTKRPENTGVMQDPEALSLSEVDWNDEQKRIFQEICQQTMQAYNYSEDKTYCQT